MKEKIEALESLRELIWAWRENALAKLPAARLFDKPYIKGMADAYLNVVEECGRLADLDAEREKEG